MPPGIKGILCIKFDLFKIKNTAFWAAYGKTSELYDTVSMIQPLGTAIGYSWGTTFMGLSTDQGSLDCGQHGSTPPPPLVFRSSVFTKISIGEKSVTKTLRDYNILVWKREIIYQECKRRIQMKTTLIKDDVILHHSRQDEKYER